MRSRIYLTLATLVALGLTIVLGVWQLERRGWKNGLIARFEAALSKPAAVYDPAHTASAAAREFSQVSVKGEFLNSRTIKMLTATPESARAHTQEPFGYLMFVPLRFSGGIVFVNRGFAPQSLAGAENLLPKAETEVTGWERLSKEPGWFTPPPDVAEHVFYGEDIPAMAEAAGLHGGETVLGEYIQAEPLAGAAGWPQARDPRELLASIPNRHLEYALTWFALAAALAGVYGAYIFRNRESADDTASNPSYGAGG